MDTITSGEFEPVYLRTLGSGALGKKVSNAYETLRKCRLCARYCEVDRTSGEKGYCGLTDHAVVSSFGPHYGEEKPLVGKGGSGTIFLSSCNLLCIFCQNYDISHHKDGERMSPLEISSLMLQLQKGGCHNINFVTPTHQMPFLIDALQIAAGKGLKIPVVWNCGGYESMESLQILEGIVDIYMPDFKFWREEPSLSYCNAKDYPERARIAITEMHRQVGDLQLDENDNALRGLLIRHLVMPENLCGTKDMMKWIAENLSPATYVNVMAQYRPCFEAYRFKEISRRVTDEEFGQALLWARDCRLRLDQDEHPRGIILRFRDLF